MSGSFGEFLLDIQRALDLEIRATKASEEEKALRAKDGRLVLISPDGPLYTFQVDREILLPADTGVLVECDGLRARGYLERIEGTSVYIVLDTDLGDPVPDAMLRFDESFLVERLREVIAGYIGGTVPYGRELVRQVMGMDDPSSTPGNAADLPQTSKGLNEAQLEALRRARAQSILFVWGPPGTGKSHTLGALAADLVLRGERVLISSHTNVAVDNAITRSWKCLEETGYGEGSAVLRVGPSQDLKELADRLESRFRAEAEITPRARPTALRELRRSATRDWAAVLDAATTIPPEIDALEAVATELRTKVTEATKALAQQDQGPEAMSSESPSGRAGTSTDLEKELSRVLGAGVLEKWGRERSRTSGRTLREVGHDYLDAVAAQRALLARALQLVDAIEERLVGRARLVGATLCKSYLYGPLVSGTFDTVILDEASMAWLAQVIAVGGRATKRIIVFGDFRQLPPISRQENREDDDAALPGERSPAALMKTDVFVQAGIREAVEKGKADSRLVLLDTQYRMHPDIAAAPSKLYYAGKLRSDPSTKSRPPVHVPFWKSPVTVVTVDTSPLLPWALKELGGHSRFNVLNAVTTAAAARHLADAMGSAGAVGVVTPYRAQARILRRLLCDLDMEDALVSTVHRFQGLERDAVVFDLTDSGPHKIGRLLYPKAGSQQRDEVARVLNVAITRPRRAFVLVTNWAFVKNQKDMDAGNNPLGRLLKEPGFGPKFADPHDVMRHEKVKSSTRFCDPASPIGSLLVTAHGATGVVVILEKLDGAALGKLLPTLTKGSLLALAYKTGAMNQEENLARADALMQQFPELLRGRVTGIEAPLVDLVLSREHIAVCSLRKDGAEFPSPPTVLSIRSPALASEVSRLLRCNELPPGSEILDRCLECKALLTVIVNRKSGRLLRECPRGHHPGIASGGQAPKCPRCDGDLVLGKRNGKRGWTCINDPHVFYAG